MPRITAILLAASIATLFGGVGLARADQHVVYEWKDAQGQVHYTDQWVPGAKLIRVQTAPAATDAATQGIQNESNAASQDVKDEDAAAQVRADEAKARAARCAQDKGRYQALIQSRRIFSIDKNGNRQYMSDAQADAVRLKAREAMDADCGGS